MSYRITWSTTAFGQMEAILAANPAQQGVLATALRRIADDLGHNPFGVGESREKDRRVAFFGPLTVTYRVIATADRVVVMNVRLHGRTG